MTTKVEAVVEPFIVTDQTSGITATDAAAGEAGADWAEIWRYQLPAGFTYHFDRRDTFSAYIEKLSDAVDVFFTDDGGTFVDDTADINDAGADDVQPYPAAQAAEDAIYFGYRKQFTGLRVVIGTAGTVLVWGEEWEYYNGAAWVSLTGLSATALTIWTDTAGNVDVTWNLPTDQVKTTVNGHDQYWVRCRLATVGTQATVDPLITSAQVHGFATPETDNSELIRIDYQDPNRESSWRLMGAVRYQAVREFQQDSKLHHLDIQDAIIVPENYWLVIQVKPTAILDASNGYFNLRAKRARYAMPF